MGKHLSKQTKQRIVSLYRDKGQSVELIATKYNISKFRVLTYLRDAGISQYVSVNKALLKKKFYTGKYTLSQLATEFSISESNVSKILSEILAKPTKAKSIEPNHHIVQREKAVYNFNSI